jgi:hypothetical protein
MDSFVPEFIHLAAQGHVSVCSDLLSGLAFRCGVLDLDNGLLKDARPRR